MRVWIIAGVMGIAGISVWSAGLVAGRHEGAAPASANAVDVTLKVRGRANATPWMAARGAFVAVAWGASLPSGKADVFVAVSRDGGASFGGPVRVNSVEGDARVGGELPPRVALTSPDAKADPEVVVAWGARTGDAKDALTEIRVARSRDGGRTFQRSAALQGAGAPGDRGWHALTLDEHGRAHVMWLDHRGLALRKASGHDHHAAGADMSQLSGLYYARAGGSAAAGGANEAANGAAREVTKGVCYCCKTALVAGADGRLYAAWRHVYPGNIRDIAFTMSRDGGRTFDPPERVSRDEWQLAGCPDDGPAMAVAADGTVHVVWPTVIGGSEPAGALFYASTRDGRTFTPRQRVPTLGSPKPGHPQIVLKANGEAVVAWDEIVSGVRRAATVPFRIAANGTATFGTPAALTTAAPSAYPMLVMAKDGVVAAWTSTPGATATIAVRRLPR